VQERDRINFEVKVSLTKFALEPNMDISTVFCLCKPKDLKQLKKSYGDLEFFTKTYSRYFQSERLYLYAEHPTIFCDIFENKQVMAAYKKIEDCLELIYYTDRKTFSREYTKFINIEPTPFIFHLKFQLENLTFLRNSRTFLNLSIFSLMSLPCLSFQRR
jgi:hypothetical protein